MDGRRLSTIPARAIGDQRLTLGHLRLLGRLGMHIDREGWCRVRQEVLGTTIGMARETVNRRLKDLVEWQYVAKWVENGKGGTASGRSIFYRVLLDTPFVPEAADNDGPDELIKDDLDAERYAEGAELPMDLPAGALHVPPEAKVAAKAAAVPVTRTSHAVYNSKQTCDPHVTSGVTAGDHTRCDVQASHITSTLTGSSTDSPPPPRKRGGREGEVEAILDQVKGADPKRVRPVDLFLGPLVRQRRFDAPSPAYALGVLADWPLLTGLADGDFAALLDELKTARAFSVKQADVEAAVKARAKLAADARKAADEARRKAAAERAALARLAPDVEPDAAPQRREALALRRAVVEGAHDGADLDDRWLGDLIVVGRAGGDLRLAVGQSFAARQLDSGYINGVLLKAARTLWPEVVVVSVETHATAAARGGRAA